MYPFMIKQFLYLHHSISLKSFCLYIIPAISYCLNFQDTLDLRTIAAAASGDQKSTNYQSGLRTLWWLLLSTVVIKLFFRSLSLFLSLFCTSSFLRKHRADSSGEPKLRVFKILNSIWRYFLYNTHIPAIFKIHCKCLNIFWRFVMFRILILNLYN